MKFCPSCGAQRPTLMPFCAACGTDLRQVDAATAAPALPTSTLTATAQYAPGPAPAFVPPMMPLPKTQRRAGVGGLLAAIAVTAVVALSGGVLVGSLLPRGGSAGTPGGWSNGSTYATPEDAVRHYMEGVAANDPDQILQACGIDQVATKFQWEAWVERLNAIPSWTELAPSQYSLYATENKYARAAAILLQVRNLAYGLFSTLPMDGTTVTPVTADQLKAYAKEVDPSALAGVKIVEMKFPVASLANDTRTISMFAGIAKVYGADSMTERLVLIQLTGKTYEVGFRLLRYGNDWIVFDQSSSLADLGATGAAKPISQSDFDATAGN